MKKRQFQVYQSGKHILATLGLIVLPFLFFLFFSKLANFATDALFKDISVSLIRITIAYLIASVLGWLLAVGFYRGRRAAFALPLFDVLQSFPTFAALPLATYFWGPSGFTVILFLLITIIWPILFAVISSLKLIRHDWEEVVEIVSLTKFDYWRYFLWPATIPGLITGSIVGVGNGWEALIATEIIVGVKSGLGNFFNFFSSNIPVTAFGILGFLILIFVVNQLTFLRFLEWSHLRMEE